MNNPHQVDRPQIIELLDNFGKQVSESKKGFLSFVTTSSSSEGILLDASLYILAPEINFEYRVINVELMNVSELKIRYFTLATNQSEHYDIDISKDLTLFQLKLNEIQNYGLFKAELNHLVNQILLKREYKTSPIKSKIVLGQARVVTLLNGQQMNAGWLRFDGEDYVLYYTGQGLREMWKPNMTAEEQERAEMLKQKKEEELIQEQMIARIKISDIKDIL